MSQRPPLTRERIIDTALHLIDGQGLGRLTMRRLGDSLQVEAMAIYHHLPHGKEQLLEQLIAHVAAHPVPPGTGEARERLRAWAGAYRDGLLRHVGVMPLIVTRRNPGALLATLQSIEDLLRTAGRTEAEAAVGAHTLLGYLLGTVALEARELAAETAPEADADARFQAGLDGILRSIA
jgi:TetR/AcrR family transcriptional regulator, tetracycline repressor protein